MSNTSHITTIEHRGTDSIWICTTCGRRARHQLPLDMTARNAVEHERKYNKRVPGR